jgi:isochorismate synthase
MNTDAVVLYRWPNQKDWIHVEGKLNLLDSKDVSTAKGFIVAPFEAKELEIISIDKTECLHEFPDTIIKTLLKVFKPFVMHDAGFDIANYNNALNGAIKAVNDGSLAKVVISRKQLVEFNYDDFLKGFKLFSDAFPSTFTYIMFSHKHGIWFGASPEILVEDLPAGKAGKSDSYLTMALAGTIKSESEITINDWKQKEIEEHEFVSQYLREKLRSMQLNYLEEGLSTSRTGNIHHLLKRFNIQKNNSTDLLSIAKALHPTPAICGIPTADAKEFILRNENYDRDLYTGFIGPVGMDYNNGLFVNLRCGKLMKNGLVLFAGGGINKGSIAEYELNETKNKMENTVRFFC